MKNGFIQIIFAQDKPYTFLYAIQTDACLNSPVLFQHYQNQHHLYFSYLQVSSSAWLQPLKKKKRKSNKDLQSKYSLHKTNCKVPLYLEALTLKTDVDVYPFVLFDHHHHHHFISFIGSLRYLQFNFLTAHKQQRLVQFSSVHIKQNTRFKWYYINRSTKSYLSSYKYIRRKV